MSKEALTTIQDSIQKYHRQPSGELLQDILGATAELNSVYQSEVFGHLEKYKSLHNMTRTEMKAFVKEYNQTDDGFFDGRTFCPMRVVEHLRRDNDYLTTNFDERLRTYHGGVFVSDMTKETEKVIIDLLGEGASPGRVESVLGLLSALTMCEVPQPTDWVNLANCRWCLSSWANLEHSPVHKSVVQLPVAYDDKARCPVFDKWIKDVLPSKDDQFLLLQLMGYSMLQDVRFR